MTIGGTLLDAQTDALLRRLGREQEMRTRRARDEATAQASDVLRRARSEARVRVHQAVLDRRREDETAIARRRAAIDTRQRRARQATLRALLDEAWTKLPDALIARWADPAAREQWCRAACAQARRSLLHLERLAVELDPESSSPALEALVREGLHAGDTREVTIVPTAGLGSGLRIRAGDACVDATLAGLLAARERVAAELLAEFERLLGATAQEGQP